MDLEIFYAHTICLLTNCEILFCHWRGEVRIVRAFRQSLRYYELALFSLPILNCLIHTIRSCSRNCLTLYAMDSIPEWFRKKMILTEPSIMFSFSYPNGEPQTPTRTPTTTVFGDSAFQTPKLESSFFDPRVTWDTSDPYASSPEYLRTPQRFGLSTPSNPLRLSDALPGRTGGVDALQDLEQETDTAKRIRSTKPNGGSGEDGPRTVDSAKSAASMQTPPPSSASRRKITGLDNATDTNRKHSSHGDHLETPSRLLGA